MRSLLFFNILFIFENRFKYFASKILVHLTKLLYTYEEKTFEINFLKCLKIFKLSTYVTKVKLSNKVVLYKFKLKNSFFFD